MFASGETTSVALNFVEDLHFERYFTRDNHHLKDFGINFVVRPAHIENSAGDVIFHQEVVVPDFWSDTAVSILAQKYFRRTGVTEDVTPVFEPGIPVKFSRVIPMQHAVFGGENSLRQVAHRLAGHWTYTGFKFGYFKDEAEGAAFYDELRYMIYMQMAAPNSPQFFNTGLFWAYGICGNPNNDHYAVTRGDNVEISGNSYSAPQIHACFINRVEDDLIGPDGIMALWAKEARIFKYGSGSGCNYSAIRGKDEPLAGGGKSSGLISFLRIGDTVGGAIKSGGTTRRAARMVILDDNHPDLLEFIDWKFKEEQKATALIHGSALLNQADNNFPLFNTDFEGEAYTTISGQNANNSVNISNLFMNAVENNGDWTLVPRTEGDERLQVYPAKSVFRRIAEAAHKCGDPAVFFGDNINSWNTCRDDEVIHACNPCAEYLWFDDTACNLASLNLLRFYSAKNDFDYFDYFDFEAFSHAVHLWTTVLDISISMAGYPSEAVANKSLEYRTLGLGYTNLGALLMQMGLAYASREARDVAAEITALMTGQAYYTSAQLAEKLGAFPACIHNVKHMRNVLERHSKTVFETPFARVSPVAKAAGRIWNRVLNHRYGFRNAQVTLLAPTGTISFVMDAQTTGIEPDFSLIKYKALAGGGNLAIVNQSVRPALAALGYGPRTIVAIEANLALHGSMADAPIDPRHAEIFACANDIAPEGHLRMLAVVQPLLSGGISKTINLPNSATVEDIEAIYMDAWKMGLKCVSIYRDGCKSSQPLTALKKSTPKDLNPSGAPETPSEAALRFDNQQVSVERAFAAIEKAVFGESEDVKFFNNVLTCKTCGHQMSVQIGVCHLCPVCGATTGCS
jgi:ribonucleoside-diphosphate reductase alpha chain